MSKRKSRQIESDLITVENLDSTKNHISKYELFSYVLGTGFYSMFIGMITNYKSDYVNNIIKLNETNQQILNVVVALVGFAVGFGIMTFIDNFHGKKGKFRPIALWSAIPMGLFGFLMFYTPFSNANTLQAMIYLVAVNVVYNGLVTLTATANSTAIVMTPNEKERNSLFSTNGFFNSIMQSAPLVIILVLGFFQYKYDENGKIIGGYYSKNTMYIIALALCAILYVAFMVNAMLKVKERVPYNDKKQSPLDGLTHVVKNKNFWFLTLTNAIREVRLLGMSFGIFVAGALLGDTSKFILIGLPTGIGTVISMLIVRKMIKKLDPIKVYTIFGVYSLVANVASFFIAYLYFKQGGIGWQIAFIASLFFIGLQFGSSNLLPNIFNADVLNEIELQSGGKRLEGTVSFSATIVTTVMTVITGILTPTILLKVCNYQQGTDIQSQSTKIKLVFFYTIFVGMCFALSLLPMIGYRLTTKKRDAINKQLEIIRTERLKHLTENQDSSQQQPTAMPDVEVATPEISDNSMEKGGDLTTQNISKEIADEETQPTNSASDEDKS
ncbi:MAG: MFS transporter [Clostridia bacterium]|nr:MFS transporter [Clostridia bacterium]